MVKCGHEESFLSSLCSSFIVDDASFGFIMEIAIFDAKTSKATIKNSVHLGNILFWLYVQYIIFRFLCNFATCCNIQIFCHIITTKIMVIIITINTINKIIIIIIIITIIVNITMEPIMNHNINKDLIPVQ